MSEETPPATEPTTETEPATEPVTDWHAEAARWKSHSRRNEDRAKAHAAELDAVKASVATERAVSALHVKLARAGVPEETVSGFLAVIDAGKLVTDGEPNGDAIANAAAAIARNHSVVNPDPDHGRRDSGEPARGFNDVIRAATGG